LFAVVDDEDYKKASIYNWHLNYKNDTNYAVARVKINKKWKSIYLHRFVLNVKNKMVVDHIDHIGLNCTKNNLRICTHAENLRNNKIQTINKTSIYKGVYWNKSKNKWCSHIGFDNKRYYLGAFTNEKHAAQAYDKAARQYFGEFALTNFLEFENINNCQAALDL